MSIPNGLPVHLHIENVEVDLEAKSWRVNLEAYDAPDRENAFKTISDLIANALPDVSCVQLVCSSNSATIENQGAYASDFVPDDESAPDMSAELQAMEYEFAGPSVLPEEMADHSFDGPISFDVDRLWPEIFEDLVEESSAVRGWLGVKRLVLADDLLTIELPSVMHVSWLCERKYAERISDAIAARSGRRLNVRLCVGQFDKEEMGIVEEEPCFVVLDEAATAPKIQKQEAEKQQPWQSSGKKNFKRKGRKPEGDAIKGKPFDGNPVRIKEVVEGQKGVIIEGEIFDENERELKNGTFLFNFYISDRTDSLNCKFFRYSEDAEVKLKKGQWVKVRGDLQYDQFTKEDVLMVNDIMPSNPPEHRKDECGEKRIELHFHTKMSAMDALCDVGEAVKRAAEWGHPAIAVTDHGVVQSFPDAFAASKKYGVKVLYGIEAYLVEDETYDNAPTYHMCVLARNHEGLRNLYRLVSNAHLKHFKRHPRIPKSDISEHREGLLISSACEAGQLYRAIVDGRPEEEIRRIASFYDYIEIMPVGNNEFMIRSGMVKDVKALQDINIRIYKLATELGIPVVATGDVHFLDPEDEVYREVLMAGQGYTDFDKQPPLYYKTTDEMLHEFSYLGEEICHEVVIENPLKIADMIEDMRPIPDELAPPHLDGDEDNIKNMSYEKAKRIYGDPLPEVVRARLERELNGIIGNKYAVIYMIAHELVKKSRQDGYLVGSRGSVGSSLVATMSDITEVNPLQPHYVCPNCKYSNFEHGEKAFSGYDLPDRDCPVCGTRLIKNGHDIPFEVFMGFQGDKIPDIDLNFSGEYQRVIHKYTEEIFGADNVFRAGTISTVAEKTAYGFAKAYAEHKGITLRAAEMTRLARGCTGVKRTTGQHPGGVMVLPRGDTIYRFTPVQRPANDTKSDIVTTHFDYHSIHDSLLKLDLLGHDDPTTIRMLEDLTGLKVTDIPMDDPDTMAIFSSIDSLNLTVEDLGEDVGTIGIPEFGTKFVRGMLQDTRPKTFAELVRISGLSHGTDVWLNNAQDLIRSRTATLDEVISVRDDIMNYLIAAGLPNKAAFKIMEQVRKGKGLTSDDEKMMAEYKVPQWYVDSCKKIKYMFPKAHAVAYVMMAFRIAYFKVHYPREFYATYFYIRQGDFDPSFVDLDVDSARKLMQEMESKKDLNVKEKSNITILEVLIEALLRGIKFSTVDILKSDTAKFMLEPDTIRLPLVSIPGLGEAAASSVVEARKERGFSSIQDLSERTKLTKTHVEFLRGLGALEGLPETDQLSLF